AVKCTNISSRSLLRTKQRVVKFLMLMTNFSPNSTSTTTITATLCASASAREVPNLFMTLQKKRKIQEKEQQKQQQQRRKERERERDFKKNLEAHSSGAKKPKRKCRDHTQGTENFFFFFFISHFLIY
ncbi:hypothetical protein QUV57_22460, partial [Xanthomonas citri pv. citri]